MKNQFDRHSIFQLVTVAWYIAIVCAGASAAV